MEVAGGIEKAVEKLSLFSLKDLSNQPQNEQASEIVSGACAIQPKTYTPAIETSKRIRKTSQGLIGNPKTQSVPLLPPPPNAIQRNSRADSEEAVSRSARRRLSAKGP